MYELHAACVILTQSLRDLREILLALSADLSEAMRLLLAIDSAHSIEQARWSGRARKYSILHTLQIVILVIPGAAGCDRLQFTAIY